MYNRVLALAICALLFSHLAWTKTDAKIQEAIETILMQRHPQDTADWWRALGENAPRVIMKMLEQTDNTYDRLRLVGALGYFNQSDQSVEYLKKEADQTTEDVIRNTAIRSLGFSQGAKEIEFVSKFLGHTDPQTRMTAAETLKKMNDSRAQPRLEQYFKEEKTSWIVAKVKGLPVAHLTPLVPVSTSEDRAHPQFTGQWDGYWIIPKAGTRGLRAYPVVLKINSAGTTELNADLLLTVHEKKNREIRHFKMTQALAKGTRLSAVLNNSILLKSSPTSSAKVFIRGSLIQENNLFFIELHAPSIGARMILRKRN